MSYNIQISIDESVSADAISGLQGGAREAAEDFVKNVASKIIDGSMQANRSSADALAAVIVQSEDGARALAKSISRNDRARSIVKIEHDCYAVCVPVENQSIKALHKAVLAKLNDLTHVAIMRIEAVSRAPTVTALAYALSDHFQHSQRLLYRFEKSTLSRILP